MTYIAKILYFLFSLTLFGFASLQLNDPDPIIWVTLYAICALIPTLLLFNKFYWQLFGIAGCICAIQLIISAPGAYQYYLHIAEEPLMQGMNPAKPYIEECREFLGVLIALGLDIACIILAKATKVR